MKILVTGGAGFIGAHVAARLAARGDEIVILDDFNDRYDPALKEARVAALAAAIPVVRGDICDRDTLEGLFREGRFDSVIHLAAWASVQTSIEKPHIYTAVNVDGTVNVLEAARKNNNWKESDSLRDDIREKGFIVEDTPQGQMLRKI